MTPDELPAHCSTDRAIAPAARFQDALDFPLGTSTLRLLLASSWHRTEVVFSEWECVAAPTRSQTRREVS